MKIAITGPESTGKSTLAIQLANYLNGTLVTEVAREYLTNIGRPYNFDDITLIAKLQFEANHQNQHETKVCDTDMAVPYVWQQVRYGKTATEVKSLWEKDEYDIVMLCRPDILWEPDPLRENPFDREYLFDLYLSLFAKSGRNVHIIEGSNRFEKAIRLLLP